MGAGCWRTCARAIKPSWQKRGWKVLHASSGKLHGRNPVFSHNWNVSLTNPSTSHWIYTISIRLYSQIFQPSHSKRDLTNGTCYTYVGSLNKHRHPPQDRRPIWHLISPLRFGHWHHTSVFRGFAGKWSFAPLHFVPMHPPYGSRGWKTIAISWKRPTSQHYN